MSLFCNRSLFECDCMGIRRWINTGHAAASICNQEKCRPQLTQTPDHNLNQGKWIQEHTYDSVDVNCSPEGKTGTNNTIHFTEMFKKLTLHGCALHKLEHAQKLVLCADTLAAGSVVAGQENTWTLSVILQSISYKLFSFAFMFNNSWNL